jgi:ribosomal protein S18 acetylase RimI-like enzyme
MTAIREMTARDLPFAYLVREVAGWGDPGRELEQAFALEPAGSFIAEEGKDPIGVVMATSYGPLAFIGNLIVLPSHRGRGIGADLMRAAIAYLQENGAETVRLDAVQAAVPLYRRLGFVEEGRSLRFRGRGRFTSPCGVLRMETSSLPEVLHLDLCFFGGDRSRLLRQVFEEAPELSFVRYDEGELVGYLFSRRTPAGGRIGPWGVRPRRSAGEIAESLLLAGLNAFAGQSVGVGVLEMHKASRAILVRHGFEEGPSSVRMRLGPDRHRGEEEGLFAIGSPAKG